MFKNHPKAKTTKSSPAANAKVAEMTIGQLLLPEDEADLLTNSERKKLESVSIEDFDNTNLFRMTVDQLLLPEDEADLLTNSERKKLESVSIEDIDALPSESGVPSKTPKKASTAKPTPKSPYCR